jgi:hypothetical protein
MFEYFFNSLHVTSAEGHIISDWVLGHLSGFDLVRTDGLVWIQIYGHSKEGMDPMSEWIIFPRIYMMVSGPAEFFFWHFPKMEKKRGSGPLL